MQYVNACVGRKPFAPDAPMIKILTDAVAVGNATARAIDFASRDKAVLIYPDRHWTTPFVDGSYEWLNNGARNAVTSTLSAPPLVAQGAATAAPARFRC